jgi:rRNA maturation endonuclease Nob1
MTGIDGHTKDEVRAYMFQHQRLDEIAPLLKARVCPACGDSLHKRQCDNRSRTCGNDWSYEIHLIKIAGL